MSKLSVSWRYSFSSCSEKLKMTSKSRVSNHKLRYDGHFSCKGPRPHQEKERKWLAKIVEGYGHKKKRDFLIWQMIESFYSKINQIFYIKIDWKFSY